MAYTCIKTETRDHVGLVTLDRPDVRNALNAVLMTELVDALRRFDEDEAIRAIVITGGDAVFAAGADIGEMRQKSFVDAFKSEFAADAWSAIGAVRKPLIAAVSGYALGGGCELAMMCDIIFCSESAKFGQPEINLGVTPGAGGTQRLTRLVGKSKAMEMCLTGRSMGAEEAERIGLVARIFTTSDLIDEVMKIAAKIAEKSPLAAMAVKESVNRSYETTLAEGLLFERRMFNALFATEDKNEGMDAFIEKRAPQFRGR